MEKEEMEISWLCMLKNLFFQQQSHFSLWIFDDYSLMLSCAKKSMVKQQHTDDNTSKKHQP